MGTLLYQLAGGLGTIFFNGIAIWATRPLDLTPSGLVLPAENIEGLDSTPLPISAFRSADPFSLVIYPDRILSISCLMKAAHASIAFSYWTRFVRVRTSAI